MDHQDMYYCTQTTAINRPAAKAAMAILDEHREIFQKFETEALSEASSFVTEAVVSKDDDDGKEFEDEVDNKGKCKKKREKSLTLPLRKSSRHTEITSKQSFLVKTAKDAENARLERAKAVAETLQARKVCKLSKIIIFSKIFNCISSLVAKRIGNQIRSQRKKKSSCGKGS